MNAKHFFYRCYKANVGYQLKRSEIITAIQEKVDYNWSYLVSFINSLREEGHYVDVDSTGFGTLAINVIPSKETDKITNNRYDATFSFTLILEDDGAVQEIAEELSNW